MKRSVIAATCTVLVLGVTMAIAQPPGKGPHFRKHKSLRTVEDFESVKKDDKVGFVCLQCHSVSELKVQDDEGAMALCKEGAEIKCPSCEKSFQTVLHGPPSKGQKHRKVTYVNDEGVQCAFITELSAEEDEGHEHE